MHTTDLMDARVQELRAAGRRASSGSVLQRRPSRLATSFRKLARRQR